MALMVALSLALVALGGSDQTRQVLPSNPDLWQTPWQSWDPFWIWLHRTWSRVMRRIIFTAPFYRAFGAEPLCLLRCYTAVL
jgi:hypothetical protein